MNRRTACLLAVGVATLAATASAATAAVTAAVDPGPTELVSRSEHGIPADAASWDPQVSADGRFVAFTSEASTLVPGDTNGTRDVFVADLSSGAVERVSVDGAGLQLTGHSYVASISADGNLVLFDTTRPVTAGAAVVLEPGTYLRDQVAGSTTRLEARGPGGTSTQFGGAALSGNGRFALGTTRAALVPEDANGASDLYRIELATGAARLVSSGLATDDYRQTRWPAISHSGRFVAFDFTARLVKRDRLRSWDVYVRDLDEPRPRLVTLHSDGTQANRGSMAPAISPGGRYVVFSSFATNLVRGDTNDQWDVFWHDRRTGVTERVSVSSTGRQGDAQSHGEGYHGDTLSVSRDGRFVVFGSLASTLDPATGGVAQRHVYLRDRVRRTTHALSLDPSLGPADGASGGGQVSADGSVAAFWSEASNLVADDVNGVEDVFVRRLAD